MSEQKWEYVAVELPNTPWKTRDRDITAKLNEVAAHGWRLTSLYPHDGGLGRAYGIFERPKGGATNV